MLKRTSWETALAACGVTLLFGTLAVAQVAAPPARQPGAAQNQGQQDRAQQERALQDRATQERAAQDQNRADQNRAGQNQPGRTGEQNREQDRLNGQRQPQADRTDRQPAREADRGQRRDQQNARRDGGQRDQQRGQQRRGLGIQFDQQAQGGLTVSNIEQGSTAAEAGLRSGDRIVSVDGRQINGPRQFQAYLSGQFGREVPVVINREGQQQTIYLSAGEQGERTAWLGVFLNDNQDNQRGAMVMQVYPAGPAARAGLRPRDVITHINGQEVAGSADLIAAIEEQEAGSKAEFTVLRNNQEVKLNATLGSRDQFVFRGQGEDFGRGEYGRGGSSGEDDEFANIPPYAMQLEHDRRMAEQHERLENQMAKLTEEVKQLRDLIQQQQRR